ncbi:hypothetical protein [Flexivirga caeni]|uniref:Uncharacterized protein n=1 Tax=Flexivirga caeni TaxID=2294115 RepID=A0A3M9MIN6_9MICO|nr:hypothetical protein [Flexivirga caeni]RNI25440.1 hypothetical protein EFY87_02140 [Flexivirga caeni]
MTMPADDASVERRLRESMAHVTLPPTLTVQLDDIVRAGDSILRRRQLRRRSAIGVAAAAVLGAAAVPVARHLAASTTPAKRPADTPATEYVGPGIAALMATFPSGAHRMISISDVGRPATAYRIGSVDARGPEPVTVAMPQAGQIVTGHFGGALFLIAGAEVNGYGLRLVFPPDRQPATSVELQWGTLVGATLLWPDAVALQGFTPIGLVFVDSNAGTYDALVMPSPPAAVATLVFRTQPSPDDPHADQLLLVRSGDRLQLNKPGASPPPQPIGQELAGISGGAEAPRVAYGWAPAAISAHAPGQRKLVVTQRPAATGGVLYAVTAAPAIPKSIEPLVVTVTCGHSSVRVPMAQP